MKLCGHRVCLWGQLAKLSDGGSQQSILGHYRIIRLAGCVCGTVLMNIRYAALDCGQVVKMAIFCKRQQFFWKFRWCIFFIRLFSLVSFIILGWAIYNNKERLPWSILIMYLQIKHKTKVTECVSEQTSVNFPVHSYLLTIVSLQLKFLL